MFRQALTIFLIVLACAVRGFGVPVTQPSVRIDTELLENGLRVVMAPMRATPMVHVRVAYHVGSRDERPDRQGFAHLFEHMMFRGSAHVGPQDHQELIGRVGGVCNGTTAHDYTQYFETVPPNQLSLALWLEADRMAGLKITDEGLNLERRVVYREWAMRHEVTLNALLPDVTAELFRVHPYRWSPIGNMEQLQAASIPELQDFFDRFYVPNNATLIISGDFDETATMNLVRQYFRWIPDRPHQPQEYPHDPPQTELRRNEVDRAVRRSAVVFSVRTSPFDSEDQPALELLCDVIRMRLAYYLSGNEHSLCGETFARLDRLEDGGMLVFGGTALSQGDLPAIERAVHAQVDLLRFEGVRSTELDLVVREAVQATLVALHSAEGLARLLAPDMAITGDPHGPEKYLARLQSLKGPDVLAVAEKYLRPEAQNILIVHAAAQDSADPRPLGTASTVPTAAPKQVIYPDPFPTAAPIDLKVVPARKVNISEFDIRGVHAIVFPNAVLPVVHWSLLLPSRVPQDPAGKEGLSRITSMLLTNKAYHVDRDPLTNRVLNHPLDFLVQDHQSYWQIGGSCASGEVTETFQRLNRVLREPITQFDRLWLHERSVLNALELFQERPDFVADEQMRRQSDPDWSPITAATLRNITWQDVQNCQRDAFELPGAVVVLSGDVSKVRAYLLVAQLVMGFSTPVPPPAATQPTSAQPDLDRPRITLVNCPGTEQAFIRMSAPAPLSGSHEFVTSTVAESILSNDVHSRLGRYIRSESGYAYSIYAGFRPTSTSFMFYLSTETSASDAPDAIAKILKSFAEISADGVTPDELSAVRLREAGHAAIRAFNIDEQVRLRVLELRNQVPLKPDEYLSAINLVTSEDVRDLMRRYVKPQRLSMVVVGPASTLKSPLEAIGEVKVIAMPAPATRPVSEELPRPD